MSDELPACSPICPSPKRSTPPSPTRSYPHHPTTQEKKGRCSYLIGPLSSGIRGRISDERTDIDHSNEKLLPCSSLAMATDRARRLECCAQAGGGGQAINHGWPFTKESLEKEEEKLDSQNGKISGMFAIAGWVKRCCGPWRNDWRSAARPELQRIETRKR